MGLTPLKGGQQRAAEIFEPEIGIKEAEILNVFK